MWDLAAYLFSRVILLICRPLAVFTACARFAFKVATSPGGTSCSNVDDPTGPPSGTEHPIDNEGVKCQAYQVQLPRDQYRFVTESPRPVVTDKEMRIKDFDIAARKIDGVEVSVTIPKVPICSPHQRAYVQHVSPSRVIVLIVLGLDSVISKPMANQ